MTITKKKLIEVALPLEAINKAAAREKAIKHGHPSSLHLWWARRPLAAARAVIFAQMVDDPSANPDLFKTEKAQEKERQRLFNIIDELVQWENTTNEEVLKKAREEIWQSWRRACAQNADHRRAKDLFDRSKLPAFHDPFAGGGALPLEAQRLGLEAYASDLNPVAVLINKAMIEIPPKFAGQSPVNPEARHTKDLVGRKWKGAEGLAEDVRYYGQWVRDEAEKRIGHLYPKVEVTAEMAKERPDLKSYIGKKLTVIAWMWARTVRSPNPAFAKVDVPLASTFMLCTKVGKESYVEADVSKTDYVLRVRIGKPADAEAAKKGTRTGQAQDFFCLMSGVPIPRAYVREEAKAGRMGQKLMAVVVEGDKGRMYLQPTHLDVQTAQEASKLQFIQEARDSFLAGSTPTRAMITGGVCSAYGLATHGDLFTDRQIACLCTLADLVDVARAKAFNDAKSANLQRAACSHFADAVATYLALAISRQTNRCATLNFWDNGGEKIQQVFGRQAFAMTWDFVEGNPFSSSTGNFLGQFDYITRVIKAVPTEFHGHAQQADAQSQNISAGKVVSTDPPYYDNINYSDLSDFFYNWLRRSARSVAPELFSTLTVPKKEELVAISARHGGKQQAEQFFLSGMTDAMRRLSDLAHPSYPISIYYAFKQSETKGSKGTASTGWETFLDAVIRAGLDISGTWPMRTELTGNLKKNVGALASSIILICHKRTTDAPTATRREFLTALKAELPAALAHLQASNIAPVDLAQAAIGPGMAVYTRYAKVLDSATGKDVTVREALAAINDVLDEALAEQEGDFDGDTRWALAWFEQNGFSEGEYGVAETLSKAKNTSISALADDGILESKRGKVRLLKPSELPADWDPATDQRLTTWEMVHHLIRLLEAGGENAAAVLVAKLGSKAEVARELAYRLYVIAQRKRRAAEALSYNGLVQSWPEIQRLSREVRIENAPAQGELI